MIRRAALLLLLTSNQLCTAQQPSEDVSVGDEVCVSGFMMDWFCIDRGEMLDPSGVVTLEEPQEHTLHCVLDVQQCVDSGHNILFDQGPGASPRYATGWTVADNALLLSVGRQLGSPELGCTTCTGSGPGALQTGLHLKVTGEVLTVDPPVIHVLTAEYVTPGADDGCPVNLPEVVSESPSASPSASTTTTSPTMAPSAAPTAVVTVPGTAAPTAADITLAPTTGAVGVPATDMPSGMPSASPSEAPSGMPTLPLIPVPENPIEPPVPEFPIELLPETMVPSFNETDFPTMMGNETDSPTMLDTIDEDGDGVEDPGLTGTGSGTSSDPDADEVTSGAVITWNHRCHDSFMMMLGMISMMMVIY